MTVTSIVQNGYNKTAFNNGRAALLNEVFVRRGSTVPKM